MMEVGLLFSFLFCVVTACKSHAVDVMKMACGEVGLYWLIAVVYDVTHCLVICSSNSGITLRAFYVE